MPFPIVGPWDEKELVVPPTIGAIALSVAATLGVALFACEEARDVPCVDNSSCDISPDGLCIAASTGNKWCAYPDEACTSSGYRFSDLDVGDQVGGTCAEGFSLQVSVGGGGEGTVTTSRGPLNCNAGVCERGFPPGTQLTITASASAGIFLGWTDACSGQGECTVVMDQNRSVGALFGMPGQTLWVRQLGGSGNDQGARLTADAGGNIIAAGIFSGTMTIDGMQLTSNGGTDVYVVKFSPADGQVQWAKSFGGLTNDSASAIAVDASNAVYVAGQFEGTVDFGGGNVMSTGSADAFVLKLNADGTYGWANKFGGTSFDGAQGLAVRGGSVVLAGVFAGSMTVGATNLTSAGQIDIFLIGLTTAGTTSWVKSFGGTMADSPRSLAIDSTGNVVMVGRFNSPMLVFASALFNAGGNDGFLVKLNGTNGTPLVQRQFGSTTADEAASVAIDMSDNIYVVGAFRDSIDFGSGTATTATNEDDVFVAKYSLAGAYQWAKTFGGNGSESGLATAVNASGDLVVAGNFCGTISFGGAPLTSATACSFTDAFAVRLSGADGAHLRSVRVGGMGSETGDGVAIDASGRMYITGYFDGFAEFGGEPLTPVGLSDSYVAAFAPL